MFLSKPLSSNVPTVVQGISEDLHPHGSSAAEADRPGQAPCVRCPVQVRAALSAHSGISLNIAILKKSNHSVSLLLQTLALGRRPWLPFLPPGGQTQCFLGF